MTTRTENGTCLQLLQQQQVGNLPHSGLRANIKNISSHPIDVLYLFMIVSSLLYSQHWRLSCQKKLMFVAYSCVPTGFRSGMVEFVEGAKTLREIQVKMINKQIMKTYLRILRSLLLF